MNARPSNPNLLSATLFALLFCSHPFAFAQDGGDGKGVLTIEGEVTDSTCVVYFKEPSVSGVQTSSSSTLKLSPVKLSDIKALTNAGDPLTSTPAKFTIVNKHKLQRIAIATSAFLAFGTTQLIANAETVTRGTPSNPSRETTITPACATGVPNIPTCAFVVPSNVNLGTAKPDAWGPLLDTTRVNATNFNIAINCSQNWTTKLTPTVTMKFEKLLGTTCFASNEFPRADATDATIEIIRDLQGFTQEICPTTATSPTTLAFKVNDPASTPQPYSDFITLQAAFRGAFGFVRPKTGPFSTRATFTVKYE